MKAKLLLITIALAGSICACQQTKQEEIHSTTDSANIIGLGAVEDTVEFDVNKLPAKLICTSDLSGASIMIYPPGRTPYLLTFQQQDGELANGKLPVTGKYKVQPASISKPVTLKLIYQ